MGKIDAFIAHIGTGGALIGVAQRLKEANPDTIIGGAEPAKCPVAYEWFHTREEAPWGRFDIDGVSEGFAPNLVKKYKHLIDDFITMSSKRAIDG